jgi:hypothetical protein
VVPNSSTSSYWQTPPLISVADVEHHNGDVLVLVVELARLVHELGLDLDETVEGLVGDEGLVPDVQLQQRCRPRSRWTIPWTISIIIISINKSDVQIFTSYVINKVNQSRNKCFYFP